MALTLVAAQQYIAKIYGGQNDDGILTEAASALTAAIDDLCSRHNWSFLLRDTSQSFTVSCATTDTDATVVPGTGAAADALKNVLVGMTVSGTGITAGTLVASITSSGSIELDTAATATNDPITLTFGGTIPIIAGTASYTLPSDFWKMYSVRLVSSLKRPLSFIRYSLWDRLTGDQTQTGSPLWYTIYQAANFDATGTQQTKIQLFRIPSAADVLLVKYYRRPDATATTVDIHDAYLYLLLDLAQIHLLRQKDADNRKLSRLEASVERRILRAMDADFHEGGEDTFETMRTPMDVAGNQRLDGVFYPNGDISAPWW